MEQSDNRVEAAKMRLDRLRAFFVKMGTVPAVVDNRIELARYIKRIFCFFQFWPTGNVSPGKRLLGWCIFILSNLVLISCLAHFLKYAIDTERFEYSEVSTDLPVIFAFPAAFMLFDAMFSNIGDWQTLLLELGNFQQFQKPHGIEHHEAFLEGVLKVSLMVCFFAAPPLVYYMLTQTCVDASDYTCGFVFPAYLPGCMTQPNRRFCSLLLLGSACIISGIAFVCSALYCQISEYFVVYLQHLQTLLRHIPRVVPASTRRCYVVRVLRYHNRILILYNIYFRLVKQVYLFQIFVTPVVLAMLAFTFQTGFKVQNLGAFFFFIFSLIYVCIFGQRLINESDRVIIAAYEAVPVDGDQQTARDLILLMLRSQLLLYIPAGSLTSCGHELLANVLKTTYSYLTLIQNTSGH